MTDRQLSAVTKMMAARLDRYKEECARKRSLYAESPVSCGRCGVPLSFERRKKKYCGRTCAAIVNNTGRVRHGVAMSSRISPCKRCGVGTSNRGQFCGRVCFERFRWECHLAMIAATGVVPGISEANRSIIAKRFLEETLGRSCSICRLTEWTGKDVPLILDHVDGDSGNWKVDNLRFVCANCDMQLPTYKARNKGRGREWRRLQEAAKAARVRSIQQGAVA